MAVTEQELQEIVRSVLSQMNGLRPSEQEETGIYDTMEEAIEAAARAQKEIRRMPLEFREKIISNIRKLTLENLTQYGTAYFVDKKQLSRIDEYDIVTHVMDDKTYVAVYLHLEEAKS